jgi:hypothetical protein
MPDYIPDSDAEFDAWQNNFVTYLTDHKSELGLVAADLTPLTTAQTAWSNGYSAHVAAQAAAQSASTGKDANRTAYEAVLRPVVARLQVSATTTDAHRAGLNITIRSKARTAPGVPATRPVAEIDAGTPRRHVIDFRDEGATRKAKPAGVMGAELWRAVGDAPPSDPGQCQFLALDTEAPYVADYAGPQVGKKAFYYLRWVNKKGQPGPWSDLFSATIGG